MDMVVTLMAEWREFPLWVRADGLDASYATDEISDVVPIDTGLLADIWAWDRRFQATYRPDDPAASGFGTDAQWDDFIVQGRVLARRLRQSVGPSVTVEYAADGSIDTEIIEADPTWRSTDGVSYVAKVDDRHPRNDPRGIVRRRVVDGVHHDEAFTRDLRWEPTEYLTRYWLGHNDTDHVAITEAEAEEFIRRMTDTDHGR